MRRAMRSNGAMLLLLMLMLPFVPPEVFSWQALLHIVGTLVVSCVAISVFVRLYYGHWPN
jgi:hypothetical protein